MEDQWDNLMLFDAAMYTEDQSSHLKDEQHWDPTQVYGVRGKMPKSVPKALEHVKTQRSDELGFQSDYELKRIEAYLRLNQSSEQNLQIVAVRRLSGRLLLMLLACGRMYWTFVVKLYCMSMKIPTITLTVESGVCNLFRRFYWAFVANYMTFVHFRLRTQGTA